MTYSLDLIFRKPSKGKGSGPSIAQIYVKHCSINEEGTKFITPRCVSLTDLEGQIERLKQELDAIRKKAKQKYGVKKNNKV